MKQETGASPHKCLVRQLDAVRLLRECPAGSVPMILTDPPYGITYRSNHYKDKNPHGPIERDWNFQIAPFLNAASVALTDGGALYLFTRWDVYPIWCQSITAPLKLKNCIIWKKDNWSAGDLEGNFGNQYEMLLFVTKGKHHRRGHRFSNIWEFSRVPHGKLLHPAQKPTDLLRRAIEASTDPGETVVDPFCGSGSTGEAAYLCGRGFLGGDLDPRMVRLSCERLGCDAPEMDDIEDQAPPECPIFSVAPPEISLWGLHPEDVERALNGGAK